MNDNDQRIRREAMRLDALEGHGDPDMDGRVAWRASDGDNIWTAAIMPAAGYDHLSMAYDAGDTLIHRLTWHPQHAQWMLRRTYTAHHLFCFNVFSAGSSVFFRSVGGWFSPVSSSCSQ